MKAKYKAKKGITLIEVIISLALIAIFMIPIGNALLTTAKRSKQAEIKQEATSQAQKILDEFSNLTELNYRVDPSNRNNWIVTIPSLPTGSDTITLDNNKKGTTYIKQKYSDKDKNTEYKIFYKLEKSNKVTQNLTVDNSSDEEKYAVVINFDKDEISYACEQLNGSFIFNRIRYTDFSNYMDGLGNTFKQFLIHVNQRDTGEIERVIIADKNGSALFNIGIPSVRQDKTEIKIVQKEDYQQYSGSEKQIIYFSCNGISEANRNKLANIDFFRESKSSVKNTKEIVTKLDANYRGNVYDTPKLSPKNIYDGVYKTEPIGDLYMLDITVNEIQKDKKKPNGDYEEKKIFEGTASSNINFIETP